MNNICTGLIIISIILFVLVYIFFPETFGNNYLESSSNKKYYDNFSQSQYDGIGPIREGLDSDLDSKKLDKNLKDSLNSENENSSPDYQELVNDAKKIKQKLDSENPDINKVLRLSNFAGIHIGNINKNCISDAPKWWYPMDKYDPNKFKEKVDYKNFIPAFDYLGNTQEVYWDFKQQLIN